MENIFSFLEQTIGAAVQPTVPKITVPSVQKKVVEPTPAAVPTSMRNVVTNEVAAVEAPLEEDELSLVLGEDDARTEKQRRSRKVVAIDVGKKVGGARKDLAELKKRFLESQGNIDVLKEIEEQDDFLAGQLAEKKHVFSWFNDDACRANGVSVKAYYAMHLLIRRLPTNAKGIHRMQYMEVLQFLSEEMKQVRELNHVGDLLRRLTHIFDMSTSDRLVKYAERQMLPYVELLKLQQQGKDVSTAKLEIFKVDYMVALGSLHIADDIAGSSPFYLKNLGSFTGLLASSKKRISFMSSVSKKYSSWEHYDELTKKVEDTKDGEEKKSRKPVWERELPTEPKREGGPTIANFKSPLEFKEHFGFAGVECGHYVKDDVALAHIVNSSRAYTDLAAILNIEPKHISLGNQLSIAFGARGRSAALGHFERAYNVINFTRDKGSLGIASHEWFHALDYFLMNHFTENTDYELLSETNKLYDIPTEVLMALTDLTAAIEDGNATGYITINPLNEYRITAKTSDDFFAKYDGDMQQFVDGRMEDYDDRAARLMDGYSNPAYRRKFVEKNARRRKKYIKETAEIAAILHKGSTGEVVYEVPYTTPYTQFYLNAIALDRGKKKYWASRPELFARAFEAYVMHELKKRGWASDYLVAGIDPIAYPVGAEAEKIFEAFANFLNVALPYLREI